MEETKFEGFDSDYDKEPIDESDASNFVDSDREYPIENRCCITGEDVRHSFCRYPDPVRGTMMVMAHPVMLAFSRRGQSLSSEFERVIEARRKQEARRR